MKNNTSFVTTTYNWIFITKQTMYGGYLSIFVFYFWDMMWVYYLGQKYANIGGKITPNFLQYWFAHLRGHNYTKKL